MRWTGGRSTNIEDRRGQRGVGRGAVGGVGGLLVAVVLSLLFGKDFVSGMGGGGGGAPAADPGDGRPYQASAEEAKLEDHVAHALGGLERTWREILGPRWRDTTLVMFTGGTSSGCGFGDSAVGPFYCPADGKVYIDLSFFGQLDRELGAPGDFAQAYVLAHEVGHHVQNLLGLEKDGGRRSNALLVMQELQADCYAGVWGHYAIQKGELDAGDLEEGLRAASSIGDDTLQKKAGRQVQPESFTHGSSAQRVAWFKRGIERGRPEDCDTFSDSGLGR